MPAIYLLIAILSSSAMTVVLKIFRNQDGNRYGIILGNYLTCVVISFLMLPDKSVVIRPDLTTAVCGVAGGFLFVAGLVSMQSSIRVNGAILTSAFSKSGLIVPLLICALFLGEKLRIIQIPGLLLIFLSFWLISTDKQSFDMQGKKPLILLSVLLACGGGDAMAKIFDHVGQRRFDQLYFLILFVTAAILTGILLWTEYKKTGKKPVLKEVLAGFVVGIPNYFSSALLLSALNGLPSFVVYPCFSAGTLLLVTLIGAIGFKEQLGKKAWIGIAMIAASLVLLNLEI